jgi:malonyl-CoA/methylmalonyl-CoA synthetase
MSLTQALEVRLRERAGAPALFWNDIVLTFADLDAASRHMAAGLAVRGVRPGDRVAVGLPNSPELVIAVLAVLRSGAVLVPVNPACSTDELAHLIDDCAACLAITHEEQASRMHAAGLATPVVTDPSLQKQSEDGSKDSPFEKGGLRGISPNDPHQNPPWPPFGKGGERCSLEDRHPPHPEDAALIVYTSGTTGLPKGVVLSHRALLSNLSAVARVWRRTESDRLLLALPCFHLHGLGLGILGSLLTGSSVVLRSRFAAEETPELLARHACNVFFGVPTMYNRLVRLPEQALTSADLSGMRLWVSGSAPLTPATHERFRQRFGYALMDRYGTTETGFVLSTPYDEPRRPGTTGRPIPDVEVRLVDAEQADEGRLVPVGDGETGELFFRGPSLFSRYWQRPEATREAFVEGFFRTGDLAIRDPDGMYRIVGRRSVDIIKSGGFKIGAVEIESCLQNHPAVAEVAVVGVPDTDRGEAVVAVVTPVPGATITADDLRAFAREHLAPHKVPARVVFMEEIPRTGPGKFKKKELLAKLSTF